MLDLLIQASANSLLSHGLPLTLLSFIKVTLKGVKTFLRAFICTYHVLLLVLGETTVIFF